MATLQIYYANGNYEEIVPTFLQFGEGFLLQDDYIIADNIEKNGIVWERAFWSSKGEDAEDENAGVVVRKVQVVAPDTLPNIQAIALNGTNCIYGSLDEEAEGESEPETLKVVTLEETTEDSEKPTDTEKDTQQS